MAVNAASELNGLTSPEGLSTEGSFAPQVHVSMSRDTSICHNLAVALNG